MGRRLGRFSYRRNCRTPSAGSGTCEPGLPPASSSYPTFHVVLRKAVAQRTYVRGLKRVALGGGPGHLSDNRPASNSPCHFFRFPPSRSFRASRWTPSRESTRDLWTQPCPVVSRTLSRGLRPIPIRWLRAFRAWIRAFLCPASRAGQLPFSRSGLPRAAPAMAPGEQGLQIVTIL